MKMGRGRRRRISPGRRGEVSEKRGERSLADDRKYTNTILAADRVSLAVTDRHTDRPTTHTGSIKTPKAVR